MLPPPTRRPPRAVPGYHEPVDSTQHFYGQGPVGAQGPFHGCGPGSRGRRLDVARLRAAGAGLGRGTGARRIARALHPALARGTAAAAGTRGRRAGNVRARRDRAAVRFHLARGSAGGRARRPAHLEQPDDRLVAQPGAGVGERTRLFAAGPAHAGARRVVRARGLRRARARAGAAHPARPAQAVAPDRRRRPARPARGGAPRAARHDGAGDLRHRAADAAWRLAGGGAPRAPLRGRRAGSDAAGRRQRRAGGRRAAGRHGDDGRHRSRSEVLVLPRARPARRPRRGPRRRRAARDDVRRAAARHRHRAATDAGPAGGAGPAHRGHRSRGMAATKRGRAGRGARSRRT
jgi:hypothetical protein